MSTRMQKADTDAIKATGKIGSNVRIQQVLSRINERRHLTNTGTFNGVFPCPNLTQQGPASDRDFL